MRARGLASVFVSVLSVATLARADKGACLAAYEGGQEARQAGHLVDARASALRCAQRDCPGAVVKECQRWAEEIDREVPTIVISARDASGNDLADGQVSLDGKAIATMLDGKPIALDPGAHVVAIDRGAAHAEARIVAKQGEHGRVVTVSFASAAPPPSASAATSATPAPPPPPEAHSPTAAIVAASVSLAALGGFAAFGLIAKHDRDQLAASCEPRCAHADVDAARTKARIGDVLLGVSILAAGASAYLFLRHDSPAETGAWHVDVRGSTSAATLALDGRF